MNNHWKPTATALLFVAACLSACAQTTNLPSAPAASLPSTPAPSAPAKPSFALPESTPLPPPEHSKTFEPKKGPHANQFCYRSADGLFSLSNQQIPHALVGASNSYLKSVYSELFSDWSRHMTLGEKNAWAKGRKVAARFVIYPDGSYSTPAITLSSDNDRDDAHTLDAINERASFAPLPSGINHPVPICMRVGFNLTLEDDPSAWMSSSSSPKP
jgi:hypothetical protein